MQPAARVVIVCAAIAAAPAWAAAADPESAAPLTSAAAVLSLTADQAGVRLPIVVTGVVTAAEPDWRGQFFLQDATGGVFVENFTLPNPEPGDVVEVRGVSHPGAFAPIISSPVWRKIGTGALPEARVVSIEDLMSGVEDGQRVEATGVVRSARFEIGRLRLDVAVGGYRLEVYTPIPDGDTATLLAARVRVRGTAASHYNAVLRHLTSVAVYVPRPEDFTVLAYEREDPFRQAVVPLNNVAQYRRGARAEQRVHVQGTVTLQAEGDGLFLQDATGGIRIETPHPEIAAVGDEVEAVGFLEYENHLPLLRDAIVRHVRTPGPEVRSRPVPLAEIRLGRHHGERVTLRGRILDRSTRPIGGTGAEAAARVTTWLLQYEDIVFTAEFRHPGGPASVPDLPIGAVIEVDGVCDLIVDTAGRLQSLKLLVPGLASLRVIERPSWWTPARLLAGVGLLSAVLLVVMAWLLTVSRKNAALKVLVGRLEMAQQELQEAHDTLEQKVIERSAQLQVEMSARKTAEVQFKAVLAERTRLARDLHDTLEQTLAGIALHLDTAAKLFGRTPEKSNHHLQLARTWLQQSQVELRHSIWDLRSRELEQFDLANALRRSAEQLVDGTGITLEFKVQGDTRGLPEVVEENVLRIGQEALTNVAKHARATHVAIGLRCERDVLELDIVDNGVGFDRARGGGDAQHHFGLVGMDERAKRIGGRISVGPAPTGGTRVMLAIPLASAVVEGGAANRPQQSTSAS